MNIDTIIPIAVSLLMMFRPEIFIKPNDQESAKKIAVIKKAGYLLLRA